MPDAPKERTPRDRSPSFPFVSLKTAMKRLEEFEQKFGRQEPTADRVYLAWGMKGSTSQAQQTVAALKAFGLVEYKGSGPKRLVAISADGRTYLRAQQDSVKREILKRVALKPKWIGYFWAQWGADQVPNEIRLDALVLKLKFNENAAPKFLAVYDQTIAFAGLSSSDKISLPEGNEGEEDEDDEPTTVEPGDLVQWTSGDANRLVQPTRVRALSQDRQWVFVDGSETGIPAQEVEIIEKMDPSETPSMTTPPKLALEEGRAPQGWEEERLIDDDGELILMRYRGKPSLERYEYIRDYLAFKIDRMRKDQVKK